MIIAALEFLRKFTFSETGQKMPLNVWASLAPDFLEKCLTIGQPRVAVPFLVGRLAGGNVWRRKALINGIKLIPRVSPVELAVPGHYDLHLSQNGFEVVLSSLKIWVAT